MPPPSPDELSFEEIWPFAVPFLPKSSATKKTPRRQMTPQVSATRTVVFNTGPKWFFLGFTVSLGASPCPLWAIAVSKALGSCPRGIIVCRWAHPAIADIVIKKIGKMRGFMGIRVRKNTLLTLRGPL
jgi:hypothetical protein